AFHVQGISVSTASINSSTKTVNIDVNETTIGTGSVHVGCNVQWGDAMTSGHAWTATMGAGPKIYSVAGVSHVYPDLTDRTITVLSDCCNSSLMTITDKVTVQLGCSDTPSGVCNATAGKAQLQIKNNSDDSKDQLKFKWLNGNTNFANDPASTEYYLCIYAPALVLQAVVPAGAPWAAAGSSGFKYKEDTGAAGGLKKIKLKGGAGNAKILIKGGGLNLDDPLPLTQPVLVQVQDNAG